MKGKNKGTALYRFTEPQQCRGKKALTKQEARSLAKKMRRGDPTGKHNKTIGGNWCMHAYKCKICGKWHVGHVPHRYVAMREEGVR